MGQSVTKPTTQVTDAVNKIMDDRNIMGITLYGVKMYTTMSYENSDIGDTKFLEFVGEVHDESTYNVPHIATMLDIMQELVKLPMCPNVDLFIEISSTFKHQEDVGVVPHNLSKSYDLAKKSLCRAHRIDTRGEIPNSFAIDIHHMKRIMSASTEIPVAFAVSAVMLEQGNRFVAINKLLQKKGKTFTEWPLKILKQFVNSLQDHPLQSKFIDVILKNMDLWATKFESVEFNFKTAPETKKTVYSEVQAHTDNLIDWTMQMQAMFMDLYTVSRLLKPYIRHAIVYTGFRHTIKMVEMLTDMGFTIGINNVPATSKTWVHMNRSVPLLLTPDNWD